MHNKAAFLAQPFVYKTFVSQPSSPTDSNHHLELALKVTGNKREIFSLALLLIELWEWKPFEQLANEIRSGNVAFGKKPDNGLQLYGSVLELQEKLVAEGDAPTTYCDVVMSCIKGMQATKDEKALSVSAFLTQVLLPLQWNLSIYERGVPPA